MTCEVNPKAPIITPLTRHDDGELAENSAPARLRCWRVLRRPILPKRAMKTITALALCVLACNTARPWHDIVIRVTHDGFVKLGGETVTLAQLGQRLEDRCRGAPMEEVRPYVKASTLTVWVRRAQHDANRRGRGLARRPAEQAGTPARRHSPA